MNTELQETPGKETALPPVVQNIFAPFAEDPGRFELIGGHCAVCDDYSFPRPEHCYHCHADTEKVSLGTDGLIYSFTVVHSKPPLGLPQPYAVAYIDLEDGPLRVFCLLDPEQCGEVDIGARVRLVVGPLGVDNEGRDCLRPYFKLLAIDRDDCSVW